MSRSERTEKGVLASRYENRGWRRTSGAGDFSHARAAVTSARIKSFYESMVRAGLYKAGDVDLAKVADTRFVNRKVGLEDKRRLGGR
jgi:hypothetical protein